MKIAMWSGPRNLSTAMMYSFAARGDMAVLDEPFYAAYLARTGLDHPMRAEILSSQPTDPSAVAAAISVSDKGQYPHAYLKLMTHHMLDGDPRDWLGDVVPVYLIRHPARVLASYRAKREAPTLEDLGFVQQAALYAACPGPVIDSADIRANPADSLCRLCAEIGLEWTSDMLFWPDGPKPFDGVWAAHWYGSVHRSTGFAGPEADPPDVPEAWAGLLTAAEEAYWPLWAQRLAVR